MLSENQLNKFPLIEAVVDTAKKVQVEWNFDESQADPIHQKFNTEAFLTELRELVLLHSEEVEMRDTIIEDLVGRVTDQAGRYLLIMNLLEKKLRHQKGWAGLEGLETIEEVIAFLIDWYHNSCEKMTVTEAFKTSKKRKVLSEFSPEQIDVIKYQVRVWPQTYSIMRAIEELSELVVVLTHHWRGKNMDTSKVLTEIADVKIATTHMELRFGNCQKFLDAKVGKDT